MRRWMLFALGCCLVSLAAAHADEAELSPEQARKKVGEKIVLRMKVQVAKDRLEKRGEIYLDAESNFRDEKNFAVVVSRKGAESLKQSGIDDPAKHFADKTIRVQGVPRVVDDVPRIDVEDAKQIRVVD